MRLTSFRRVGAVLHTDRRDDLRVDGEYLGVRRAERGTDPLDRLFDPVDLAARTQRQSRHVKRRAEQIVGFGFALETVRGSFVFHPRLVLSFFLS